MMKHTTPSKRPATVAAHVAAPEQPSAREAINDGVVTAKLRAGLMADPTTKGYLIQVETFHGAILLSGYVEFATVRIRALQLAREISGTNDVTDSLECRET